MKRLAFILILLIATPAFAGPEIFLMVAKLSAPTTPVISVTPGDTQNVIALTSGGVGATSYDLKWGTTSGSRTNTISGVTLPYTHTSLTNGTPYYYSLVAINGAGSTESTEVSGTPAASNITYVGAGTFYGLDAQNAGNYSVDVPTSNAGDFLLLVTTNIIATPSGWTQIYYDAGVQYGAYYRFRPSGTYLTETLTAYDDGEGGQYAAAARIYAFRNVNSSTPFDQKDSSYSAHGVVTTVTGTAFSGLASNSMVCMVEFGTTKNATAAGGAADTLVAGYVNSTTPAMHLAYDSTAAGKSTAPTITLSSAQQGSMFSFALKH